MDLGAFDSRGRRRRGAVGHPLRPCRATALHHHERPHLLDRCEPAGLRVGLAVSVAGPALCRPAGRRVWRWHALDDGASLHRRVRARQLARLALDVLAVCHRHRHRSREPRQRASRALGSGVARLVRWQRGLRLAARAADGVDARVAPLARPTRPRGRPPPHPLAPPLLHARRGGRGDVDRGQGGRGGGGRREQLARPPPAAAGDAAPHAARRRAAVLAAARGYQRDHVFRPQDPARLL
mmetsp:Transcript_23121/g.68810  ORF Transcript_23121/g.68810 Transcript_23121/m.68810 type:complete len:239 (-) Transcript_23121:926-1642(-)